MIKTILYDLDGVLVDACDWHYESLNRALNEVAGFVIPRGEHEKVFNGLPTRTKLDIFLKHDRIEPEQVEPIFELKQKYTDEFIEGLTIDKDKIRLHKNTNGKYILGCVTNAIRSSAEKMLLKTGQWEYLFACMVTNEDIHYPKPNSEGYIKAMIQAGSYPDETLIVEDSPKGIKAANNTGAVVVEVKNATEVTWDLIKEYL